MTILVALFIVVLLHVMSPTPIEFVELVDVFPPILLPLELISVVLVSLNKFIIFLNSSFLFAPILFVFLLFKHNIYLSKFD